MPVQDVLYLLLKPFMGQKKGATKAEVVSRLVEHADMKDAAAQLTQVADEMLHNVFEASHLERLRIQQAAEGSREICRWYNPGKTSQIAEEVRHRRPHFAQGLGHRSTVIRHS
jgi:hypothetical protein